MHATGGDYAAGIGTGGFATGQSNSAEILAGDIRITGGTVIAEGGIAAAGIGTGRCGTCVAILIDGGDVTAAGHANDGAGIGCGWYGAVTDVIGIASGEVRATAESYAAGIGSTRSASCKSIQIFGGNITATGGRYGSGIGAGYAETDMPSTCGDITITGGTILASGGLKASGIGAGYAFRGGTTAAGGVSISGGISKIVAVCGPKGTLETNEIDSSQPLGGGNRYNSSSSSSIASLTVEGKSIIPITWDEIRLYTFEHLTLSRSTTQSEFDTWIFLQR